jgi:hypothetical protein
MVCFRYVSVHTLHKAEDDDDDNDIDDDNIGIFEASSMLSRN